MNIKNPYRRLDQFWGQVDLKHIKLISKFIKGNTILDLGCGFGTTTNYLSMLGYNCIGVDNDNDTISFCQRSYSSDKFEVANAEDLPFENNYFDTIILRDALHHLYTEADFSLIKKEILRVSKNSSRIIFFDPNVNFILRTMRKISLHQDQECKFEDALKILESFGFKMIHYSFNTLFSLPLSGGYVGINFIPNSKSIQSIILDGEHYLETLVSQLGLGRQLCWRYLIVGDKLNEK